jgi:hypothetical protein
MIPPLPSEGKLAKTPFPRYMPMAGPSDEAASNPGMFISNLLSSKAFKVHRVVCELRLTSHRWA